MFFQQKATANAVGIQIMRHHKHDKLERKRRKYEDDDDESSAMGDEDVDSPAPAMDSESERPLRLVLKVNAGEVDSSGDHHERRHKHKKKKKKRDMDRHRRDDEDRQERKERKRREALLEEQALAQPLKRQYGDEGERRHAAREAKCAIAQLTSEQVQSVLVECLSYIQRIIQRKDLNAFFAYPVNDVIAPGYSSIISEPMDFSTMRYKIDNGLYVTLAEYKSDFKLMCNNAMIYNHPETVYYKAAQKLMNFGLRQMSREKINQMRRGLSFMSNISAEELGVGEDEPLPAPIAHVAPAPAAPPDPDAEPIGVVEDREPAVRELKQKRPTRPIFADLAPMEPIRVKPKSTALQFEAPQDDMSPQEILEQARAAAKSVREKLTLRAPNSKIGFLRRRQDGSTSLRVLNPENDGIVSETERIVNLGLLAKLTEGTGSIPSFKEDKRNIVRPMSYLDYGPFSSYAPTYDSAHASLTKEESDLLISTYGDEMCVSYASSMQNFVEDSGELGIRFVDNLLNILTNGEHDKAKRIIEGTTEEAEGQAVKKEDDSEERGTQSPVPDGTAAVKQEASEDKPSTPQPATPQSVTPQPSDERMDFDSLQSLSELGIDTSFLEQYQKPELSSEKERALQEKLNLTADLITDLQKAQYDRLGQRPPPHLSCLPGPSTAETDLVDKVTKGLTEMAKEVTPRDLISVDSIRNAMGIALEPTIGTGLSQLETMDTLNSLADEIALDQPGTSLPTLFDDPEDTLKEFFDNPSLVDSPAIVTSTGSPT